MNDLIAADFGIRQLHAQFCDAVWRKDGSAFAACFAPDGEWKIAGLHIRGAEIGPQFDRLLGICARVRLILGLPLLDVTADGATGRIPVTELAKMADGSAAMTLGTYYDRYVEQGGHWLFAARHWTLHYRGPVDLSAALVDFPDYGPPPGMPATDAPTAVRKAG